MLENKKSYYTHDGYWMMREYEPLVKSASL